MAKKKPQSSDVPPPIAPQDGAGEVTVLFRSNWRMYFHGDQATFPAEEAQPLIDAGIAVRPAAAEVPESAGDDPQPVDLGIIAHRCVEFLKSRGYPVETVAEAKKFVAGLDSEVLHGFFVEAAEWISTPESTK